MSDKQVVTAVVMSGILSSDTLREMKRWGLPLELIDQDAVELISTPERVVGLIEEALDSEGQVTLRDTDLDIIRRYLTQQEPGQLHLHDEVTGEKAVFKCFYCKTKLGEIAIPWRSESIAELIVNPQSYLKTNTGTKLYFSDVRELFFGGTKTFMVAMPITKEETNGAS